MADQRGRLRVHEVAEHVDLGVVVARAHLDAGDHPDGALARGVARLAHAGHGVVVGEGDHVQAPRHRGVHHGGGGEVPVRGPGMDVQVDPLHAAPETAHRRPRRPAVRIEF